MKEIIRHGKTFMLNHRETQLTTQKVVFLQRIIKERIWMET